MSIEGRKVNQIWLGDSHLMAHHGAPLAYANIIRNNPVEGSRFRQEPNLGWLQEGRKITSNWVHHVCRMIYNSEGTPTCYVLCVGTTNLRNTRNPEGTEIEILRLVNVIANVIKDTANAALVIISPIPDNTGMTDVIGEKLDKDLNKLTQVLRIKEDLDFTQENFGLHQLEFGLSNKIFYCRFRSRRLPYNGGPTRWDLPYFKDQVHLNFTGIRMLMDELFKTQCQIPNETFSLYFNPRYAASIHTRVRVQFPGYSMEEFDRELDAYLKAMRRASYNAE